MDIQEYWKSCLYQNAEKMRTFFHKDAYINWHNTNEHFTVDEFIRVNCEYPGKWDGEILQIEYLKDMIITIVHVFSIDKKVSCHVVSFIKVFNDKIVSIDEYWGDDGMPPAWRIEKMLELPLNKVI